MLAFAAGVLTSGALLHVAGEGADLAGTRTALFALGVTLAVAGGSFLYCGATDRLPEAGEETGRGGLVAFLTGVGLMIAIDLLGPSHF